MYNKKNRLTTLKRFFYHFCKNLIFYIDFSPKSDKIIIVPQFGALAQLGERYAGSVEVSGSIPLCSIYIERHETLRNQGFFYVTDYWIFYVTDSLGTVIGF